MIINSIYILITTLSFSILGNVRGKNLIFSSLGGGLTWFFYLLSSHHLSSSSILCFFIASVVASIYSEVMARVLKTPATTFVICAVIPLVPGGGMYNTMLQSIQGHINESLSMGLNTLEIAGTIAVGIFLVSSISKVCVLFKRKLFKK
ncbi:threonine/serine exporter family protein [Clostridium sp. WILCCON 0269]|uniref:Threonine/serine exporter family protein n=1 Tax=Candidatus Clostridium eludens TaxID=3381663 RepID=A0ABW8SKR0_9CLOT